MFISDSKDQILFKQKWTAVCHMEESIKLQGNSTRQAHRHVFTRSQYEATHFTIWVGIPEIHAFECFDSFFFYLQKKKPHTQNAILKSKKSVPNLILLFNRAAEKWLEDVAIWRETPESREEGDTVNM